MEVWAGDHVNFPIYILFLMYDVLQNLKETAKVKMWIFFWLEYKMDFIMRTFLENLPDFELNRGFMLDDMVFNIHTRNVDLVDLFNNLFNIILIYDEEFWLNTGQIED